MTKEKIQTLVLTLIRKITLTPDLEVDNQTNFEDIGGWDSLNTVDLEMELESALGISFEMGEFLQYNNIATLQEALEAKTR
jgi:acyl carrier protein